jgi:hypothetical protein
MGFRRKEDISAAEQGVEVYVVHGQEDDDKIGGSGFKTPLSTATKLR